MPAVRYLSLFSGVDAASLAWEPLGWAPAAFAEIEPFPAAVLAHRWPHVPNLGDVRGIDGGALDGIGPVDLAVFGWPCQDHSVAGKKAGIEGERSGLFYEAIRIVRLAADRGCRWFVAENVPGLLSNRRGGDFAAVLREITGCAFPVPRDGWRRNSGVARGVSGWSVAWRVLDAQHFGVPQRRRRVFLVGHLGDWRDPVRVLLEPDGLSRNPPADREAESYVAGCLSPGAHPGGFNGQDAHTGHLIARSLTARNTRNDGDTETLIAHTLRGDGFDASEDGTGRGTPLVACTLPASNGGVSSGYHPVIPIDMRQASRGDKFSNNRREGSSGGPPGTGIGDPGDPCPTLAATHTPAIAGSGVRRLMPVECERLQGMPDNHTRIPIKPVPAKGQTKARSQAEAGDTRFADIGGVMHVMSADGPRYKAIGNSKAVPVVRWIGLRLKEFIERTKGG